MPNDRGSNSRWMISAGNVIRWPTEKPNTAQAAISTTGFVLCVITASAIAWLAIDATAALR